MVSYPLHHVRDAPLPLYVHDTCIVVMLGNPFSTLVTSTNSCSNTDSRSLKFIEIV